LSEIRATTISDAAGTGPVTLTKQSAAKAWVHFNGTSTIAIDDSFNTASLTDRGTGAYSQNFSSNMSNDNYSAVIGARANESYVNSSDLNTSALCACGTANSSGSVQDVATVCLSIDGDLA